MPPPQKRKLIKILGMPVAPPECSSLSEVTFLKQWAVLKGWATAECLTGQTTEVSRNELRGFDLLSWQHLSDSNDKPRGSPNKSSPTNFISPSCQFHTSLGHTAPPTSLPSGVQKHCRCTALYPNSLYLYIKKKVWWTVCVVSSQTPHTVRPDSEFLRKCSPEIQYIKVQL